MADQSGIPPEFRSYGLDEVARILTESGRPTTVRMLQDYCKQGLLRGLRVGSTWRVSQAHLGEFLSGPQLVPGTALTAPVTTAPASPANGAPASLSAAGTPAADPVRRARRALDELKNKLELERRRRQDSLSSAAPAREGGDPAEDEQDYSVLVGEARAGGADQAPGRVFEAEEGLSVLDRPAGHVRAPATGPGPDVDVLLAAIEEEAILAPEAALEEAIEEEEFPGRGLRMVCELAEDEEGRRIRHGVYESWYAQGQQAARGEYRLGLLDGAWQQWHENGRVNCVGLHVEGLPQGPWTWWDDDGRKTQEVQYERGRLDGLWAQFHPNGRKWCEGRYRDGMPEGPFRYWDVDGRPA